MCSVFRLVNEGLHHYLELRRAILLHSPGFPQDLLAPEYHIFRIEPVPGPYVAAVSKNQQEG
jgi:hypothetical protein